MFRTVLVLEALDQPDEWQLMQPLIWKDDEFGLLEVPYGFHTDLASTPFHIADNGPARRPAVVHDWLYDTPDGRRHGKAFADSFLRCALRAEGASRAMAWTFYLGVKLFGGPAWRASGSMLGEGNGKTQTPAAP